MSLGLLVDTLAGPAVAFVAARALGEMLSATSARDPLGCTLVASATLAVTAVATWLPARRAADTDPSGSFGHE